MSHVAWSVCLSLLCLFVSLSVYWSHRCAAQKRPNRSRCHLGADSRGPKEQWSRNPFQDGTILGNCPVRWKALGVSAAVYAAKEIIQSSITVRQRDCCSRLVGVILHCPPRKIHQYRSYMKLSFIPPPCAPLAVTPTQRYRPRPLSESLTLPSDVTLTAKQNFFPRTLNLLICTDQYYLVNDNVFVMCVVHCIYYFLFVVIQVRLSFVQ